MSTSIVRVLTDGIAQDLTFEDQPHTAGACFGSTVRYHENIAQIETTIQLIVDGEVEYERTITPEYWPECETCGDPIDYCPGHGDLP